MVDIRHGAGVLKDGATITRDARTQFVRDAEALRQDIAGMAAGWQGEGGSAFQGLAAAWQARQERISAILSFLADALDDTDRTATTLDADVGSGLVTMARGLDA